MQTPYFSQTLNPLCGKQSRYNYSSDCNSFQMKIKSICFFVWRHFIVKMVCTIGSGTLSVNLKRPLLWNFDTKFTILRKKTPTISKVTINCPQLQGIDIARNSVTREVGWHGRSLSKFNVVEFQRKFDWRYQRQKRFGKNLDFELFQDLTWDVPKS